MTVDRKTVQSALCYNGNLRKINYKPDTNVSSLRPQRRHRMQPTTVKMTLMTPSVMVAQYLSRVEPDAWRKKKMVWLGTGEKNPAANKH